MPKQIRLNAFDMNCVGHQSPGLWTHPRDRSDRYNTLDYWVELAKLLERGKFDALFLADVLGVYDVYRGSPDAAIANAVQVPVNDPLLLIPAMAYVTRNLGFGVTCAVSYEHPYTLARRFSTLDHLTGGRIGWNVVTGYLNSAAKGIGLARQPEHGRFCRSGRARAAAARVLQTGLRARNAAREALRPRSRAARRRSSGGQVRSLADRP